MEKTELAGGKVPRVTQARKNAFDRAKQARFLAELAATCNVSLAAKRAGVSVGTVYDRKAKDAAFRAGWGTALGEAYRKLELMMLERAMNGTVKTVTKHDGTIDRTHEYPNAIALTLLRLHRDTAAEAEELPDEEDTEALRAEIARRIERIRQMKRKK
jgi:hypothetical protein